MLCNLCQGSSVSKLRSGYYHASSLQALKLSGENGCLLCSLLWNDILARVDKNFLGNDTIQAREAQAMREPTGFQLFQDFFPEHEKDEYSQHNQEQIILTVKGDRLDRISVRHGYPDNLAREIAYVSLFTRQDNAAAAVISGREVTPDASSPRNFELIRSWIHECTKSHSSCKTSLNGESQDITPLLPTRVLDVGPSDGSQEPRLHISASGEKSLYLTLSHCWGSSRPLTTTKSTLKEREQLISMESLPPTFRDAVIITRNLGFKYLWIDSLCILQDSVEDWQIESSRMQGVYKQSFLTINAAGASSDEGGCFISRPRAQPVQLPLSDCTGNVYVTEYIDDIPLMKREILDSRAWCLQETALSPRLLVYGTRMLGWLCNSGQVLCEQSREPFAIDGAPRLIPRLPAVGDDETALRAKWNVIVEDYSSRHLTFAKDKFPALSGLAQEFQIRLRDTYTAGLWKNNLIDDLQWKPSASVTRPALYRGPSWSWASLEGQIKLRTQKSNQEELVAEILEVQVELAGPDKCGEVSCGVLEISGPFCQIDHKGWGISVDDMLMIRDPNHDPTKRLTVLDDGTLGPSGVWHSTCCFDVKKETDWISSPVWFLGVTLSFGLLLVKGENDENYRRAGYLSLWDYDKSVKPWFMNSPRKAIKII